MSTLLGRIELQGKRTLEVRDAGRDVNLVSHNGLLDKVFVFHIPSRFVGELRKLLEQYEAAAASRPPPVELPRYQSSEVGARVPPPTHGWTEEAAKARKGRHHGEVVQHAPGQPRGRCAP